MSEIQKTGMSFRRGVILCIELVAIVLLSYVLLQERARNARSIGLDAALAHAICGDFWGNPASAETDKARADAGRK
ncbi:hypothetical protein [Trinickia dinghuensis]|uniref:Uncharacterized protein n=1 Tax=Trinickia dinghuensis TaxID=2291023 RepID=A0A3D8JP28_9BURK|nr:hypothetical protein [Trinickia dinghuensis]RDU94562.1 hypothetical protein DWV00_33320 [Trinickia dinghuensis]